MLTSQSLENLLKADRFYYNCLLALNM